MQRGRFLGLLLAFAAFASSAWASSIGSSCTSNLGCDDGLTCDCTSASRRRTSAVRKGQKSGQKYNLWDQELRDKFKDHPKLAEFYKRKWRGSGRRLQHGDDAWSWSWGDTWSRMHEMLSAWWSSDGDGDGVELAVETDSDGESGGDGLAADREGRRLFGASDPSSTSYSCVCAIVTTAIPSPRIGPSTCAST